MHGLVKRAVSLFQGAHSGASADAPSMETRRFTLAFEPELEAEFQEDYFNSSIGLLRMSFLLGALYYSVFAILDHLVVPEVQKELLAVRFAIVIPVIVLIFLLSFTRSFRNWWQLGAVIATVASGLGIVIMTVISPDIGRSSYYPGIMLVLFYCYMLIRLRFVYATLAGWFIFLTYLSSHLLFPGVDTRIVTINLFFITGANVLGMFGGYSLEYYMRKDFFFRHLLKQETEKVERSNLELEDKVREKTKQLQQSQKMESFGALAGGIAHDFNNLLTIINGYSDIALSGLSKDDRYYSSFTQIQSAGEKAASLTRQLLAFSRKQVLEPEVVDIGALMNNLSKMLNRLIGEDYTLIIRPEDDLRYAEVDPGQIEQVLMNLVINARDASPSGSSIRMVGENRHLSEEDLRNREDPRPGEYLLISVEDDGTGMDPDTVEHIFEPFFTTKDAGTGTGLGLSVVYGIIEQHNGWIDVDSEVGVGTTFNVYLPAIFEERGSEDDEQEKLDQFHGDGERVLLIEDEDHVREMALTVLKNAGYWVFDASDVAAGREAFEREKGRFVLVISDVVLPDGSGVDLVKELRSQNPELQVLLNSGYTAEKSNLDMIHEEGYRFLQKPYPVMDLLKAVKQLVDEKRPK